MRSISESSGQSRSQARDKRQKVLSVRKLLEFERAQQKSPIANSTAFDAGPPPRIG